MPLPPMKRPPSKTTALASDDPGYMSSMPRRGMHGKRLPAAPKFDMRTKVAGFAIPFALAEEAHPWLKRKTKRPYDIGGFDRSPKFGAIIYADFSDLADAGHFAGWLIERDVEPLTADQLYGHAPRPASRLTVRGTNEPD
jgi:hypothetical protein